MDINSYNSRSYVAVMTTVRPSDVSAPIKELHTLSNKRILCLHRSHFIPFSTGSSLL